MYQKPENAVQWEFAGSFLAGTKKKIEEALIAMPGSRLSYLEVKMFRKVEDDSPLEEYNLSVGESGMQICPDDEIDEDEQDVQPAAKLRSDGAIYTFPANILEWFRRICSRKSEVSDNNSTVVPQDPTMPRLHRNWFMACCLISGTN